jgi:hypothetical protein
MNWDELESLWKRQEPLSEPSADLETLRNTFGEKSRKLARNLFWRDLREAVVGVGVAGFLASVAWHRGKGYWPFAFPIFVILGVSLFFVLERTRVRKTALKPGAPLLAKLEADIAELRHQRRLQSNVATWYLAPLMGALAIILATLAGNQPRFVKTLSHQLFLAGYIGFCIAITWGIWALNQRAVRRGIDPRISELERMRASVVPPN